MDTVTDDMREIIRAAHNVAPNGETLILQALALPNMDERTRLDAAFILERELKWLEAKTEYTYDATGGAVSVPNPKGTPYALSKVGRVAVRQVVADDVAARKKRTLAVLKWGWGILMTVVVGVSVAHINKLFDLAAQPRQEPTTRQAP